MQNAHQTASSAKRNGLLILQGGGNSLHALGVEETVKSVLSTVKEIQERRVDVKIAVLGVLPRPKESKRYEGMRVNVNRRLQTEICAMKASLFRKREGDVSFLDMDSILPKEVFARDGVHLNAEGDACLGWRLLQWIKEKERCHVSNE